MEKVTSWTHTGIASHKRWQWSWCPLPTMTLSEGVVQVGRPKLCTKCSWTKFWVLPPSTKITTCCSAMWPNRRKVSGARWSKRVCKLIWAEGGVGVSGELGKRSISRLSSYKPSYSSTIIRKTLEEHLWLRWKFSPQGQLIRRQSFDKKGRRLFLRCGQQRRRGRRNRGGRWWYGEGGRNGCRSAAPRMSIIKELFLLELC